MRIVLSPALFDEGAVVVLAYNETRAMRSPPLFIDAAGARSLTSAMEMREAQKVEAKREMAAAAKAGKKVERGAHGLSGVAAGASPKGSRRDVGSMDAKHVKTLKMHKKVENEYIAKALLMRFLSTPDGQLLCRLLRGDSDDTPFCVEENPGIPEEYIDETHKQLGWDPDKNVLGEAGEDDDDDDGEAAAPKEAAGGAAPKDADGPIADGRHASQ